MLNCKYNTYGPSEDTHTPKDDTPYQWANHKRSASRSEGRAETRLYLTNGTYNQA